MYFLVTKVTFSKKNYFKTSYYKNVLLMFDTANVYEDDTTCDSPIFISQC